MGCAAKPFVHGLATRDLHRSPSSTKPSATLRGLPTAEQSNTLNQADATAKCYARMAREGSF
jgi:hypothetical protein